MNNRPLLLAASAVALFISACSTPADIQVPTLEPQFGTVNNDSGDYVAANTEGIYVGGQWNSNPSLIKFTRDGRLPWLREIEPKSGDEFTNIYDVALAPSGHAFVLYASVDLRPDEGAPEYNTFYLRKHAPDSELVWERKLTGASNSTRAVSLSTDKFDNLYIAFRGADAGLYKYNAGGTLVWHKTVPGIIADMAVSPNGFAFTTAQVAGVDKLTRYHPSGTVLWSKTVPFITTALALGLESEVYVGGVNPRVTELRDGQLAAYNARGDKLWQRTIRGNNGEGARPVTLAADTQGNAYIAANTGDIQANTTISFVQRYSPGGTKAWSYQLVIKSPSDAVITDVAAVSPAEVYVVGGTTAKVNGTNKGGYDGFVLRLNGQGQRVWSR